MRNYYDQYKKRKFADTLFAFLEIGSILGIILWQPLWNLNGLGGTPDQEFHY